jgi:two-component system CheB/CheR fusion protein
MKRRPKKPGKGRAGSKLSSTKRRARARPGIARERERIGRHPRVRSLPSVVDELNEHLSQVNNDIDNVLASVNLPIVILGADLRIRRFTPAAVKSMNLVPGDVGRRITDIESNLDFPDLSGLIHDAIDTVSVSETTIRDTNGHWYSLRIRPYRTLDQRIDGAVMILMDIDALKRSIQDLEESRTYTQSIVDRVTELLLVLDADLRVRKANRAFCEMFQVDPREIEGQLVEEIGNGVWNRPAFLDAARRAAAGEVAHAGTSIGLETPTRGARSFVLRVHRLLGDPSPGQVLCAIIDVTEQHAAETALGAMSGRLLGLQDEVQRRIARELHDITAQNASALAMNLAIVLESSGELGEQIRRVLTDSRGLAEQTAREVRDLASLLHPPLLDEVGLAEAIRHHLDSFRRHTGIDVRLTAPDRAERLPHGIEMAVFRIVQESLANVQRHSESETARVSLEVDPDQVRISVRDRGRGFVPEGNGEPGDRRGLGISGMRERTRLLGGVFRIRSGTGGTTVEARIPIPDEDRPEERR